MYRDRGFSLLSILTVLLIAGLGYCCWRSFGANLPSFEVAVVSIPGASQSASCRISRRELERTVFTWSLSHPDTPATFPALRSNQIDIPGCPGGGRWLLRGDRVECTLHREPEARPEP